MIFHDVNKAAKGILKDFLPTRPDGETEGSATKKPVEKRLRVSRAPRKLDDFRDAKGPASTDAGSHNALRLSPRPPARDPLSSAPDPRGARAVRIWATGLAGLVLCLVLFLSYSAWQAAGTEIAYARDGLSRITEGFAEVRTLYAAGRIAEAGTALERLSSGMEDFVWNLRMRLLLPQERSSVAGAELPAATLDFVSHALSASRRYREAYAYAGGLAEGKADSGLAEMAEAFRQGTEELVRAHAILASIRTEGMPEELRSKLHEATAILAQVSDAAMGLQSEMPTLLDALGGAYPRRYAILLQNADEMRPTGGFIGGVLFIDVTDGRLAGSEYFDVYELDWRLPSVEPAPADLAGISPEYGLRDSNRFPDFPRSAREALSFFEKQGVPTVDGVVAINHRLLEQILSATGPIQAPTLAVPLSATNVSQVLSLVVESKRNPEKPKSIIKELVPTVLDRASRQPVAVLRVLLDAVRRGDIALYAVHPSMQAAIERSGLAGIPRTPGNGQDYLSITERNVGGNKSDRYVTEQVSHLTTFTARGAEDTLRIVRQHGFSAETARSIRALATALGMGEVPESLMGIMGQGQNKTIVSVSVPLGSLLLSTAGIPSDIVTVSEDDGKTVFSFPMNVLPGNLVDATLTYSLPASAAADGRYELILDKQVGQKAVSYDKRLEFAAPVTISGAPMKEYGKRIDLDRSQTFLVEWK